MKLKILSLIMIVPLFLCSCEANREIDEQSIVSAVCFDWKEQVTVYLEVLSVGQSGEKIGTRIFSACADTVDEVFERLSYKLPKRPLYDHCAAIILFPDMTEQKKKALLKYCVDEPTVNLSTPVVYTASGFSLLSLEHESAAVGYDIMQILRRNGLEEQSRLYKTADDLKNVITFKDENGKVVME